MFRLRPREAAAVGYLRPVPRVTAKRALGILAALLVRAAASGSDPNAVASGTSAIWGTVDGVEVEGAVEGPATQKTPLQVACLFEYSEGDIFRSPPALVAAQNGMVHLDQALHGNITELRKSGAFVGRRDETMLLTPPAGAIGAQRLLLIGLGNRDAFTPEVMIGVGSVAMREALRLGVDRYAFASDLKDAGIDSPDGPRRGQRREGIHRGVSRRAPAPAARIDTSRAHLPDHPARRSGVLRDRRPGDPRGHRFAALKRRRPPDLESARMSRFLRAGVAAAFALVLAASCRRGDAPGRVIVFGLDGADPATIDLLLSEGKLPHFARLRREGAYAPLQSQKPLLSPVIWTTIATGKTPDVHRIGHFVAVNAAGEQLPVTSRMRRVKALWNILTDRQRSSAVVGWWATWPAETIRGSVVTDHFAYHFLMEDSAQKPEAGARTFPPELEKRIAPDAKPPQDVTREELAPFVTVTDEEFAKPFDFESDLSHFKWAYATAGTYTRIGLRLWKEDRPDDLFVYIEGLDSTSHLFGHLFRAGNLSGELAEQQRKYGHAVEQMYVYADRLVGSVMDAMDSRTTLLVLSDHGFELGRLQDDPSKTRDMRRVSELFHRPEGILYMYGYRVKPRTRLQRPTILDVAPTVLALNGLPRASDMPGRVLAEALDVTVLAPVPSYETASSTTAAPPEPAMPKPIRRSSRS